MTWARCVLDWGWHAIDDHRDHQPGVLEAECSSRPPVEPAPEYPAPRGRPGPRGRRVVTASGHAR